MRSRYIKPFLIACLVLIATVTCSTRPTVPADTAAPGGTGTVSSAPLLTPTQDPASPAPTNSPLPRQPRVILAAPARAEALLLESVQTVVSELATAESLDFEVRTSLTASDLTPEVRIVVAILSPGRGDGVVDLSALAAAAPDTQFLGIGPAGELASNVSLIKTDGSNPGQVGFLGGYLAAVVTPEWRVGALIASDDPAGFAARQGFLNGVVFYCGLCQQTYPPFLIYPVSVELPSTASPAEWQAAAATLVEQAVQTVFIGPGAWEEGVLATMAEAGLWLIGSQSPPAALKDQWIATVSSDVTNAIQSVWPDLVAGRGGVERIAPIVLKDINPDLLSPGRQLQVEKLIPDLQNGFIDVGVTSEADNP